VSDSVFSTESNVEQLTLDQLALRICTAHKAVQAVWSNALDQAFIAGDGLIEVKKRGVTIGWKRWLREVCHLAPSTAALYVQIAKHRVEIEAKLQEDPNLSLRAARRLISKRKTARSSKPEKPALVKAVNAATDAEVTEALVALGFDRFLGVMPAEWRPLLEIRAGRQILSREKAKTPNKKIKYLRLVSDSEQAPSTHH
jgi:hypothetical protein